MRKRLLYACVTLLIVTIGLILVRKTNRPNTDLAIETPNVAEHFIGKVKLNCGISIRILVLKHCREKVADTESQDIIEVANLAATQGLSISDLGSHHIDLNGKIERLVYTKKVSFNSLKAFISEQMKINADTGDTLIIYTTGHGSAGGSVQILGSRKELGVMMAEAAEENSQETIWWQSSCYAAAGLPNIKEMKEKQQELFSMIASSDASHPSYWGDQEEPIKRVLLAIAKGSEDIDPDQNKIITAKELGDFLNTVKKGAGDLVFARSPDEPLFGALDIPNLLPIVDPNGQQQPGSERYIPTPTTHKSQTKD